MIEFKVEITFESPVDGDEEGEENTLTATEIELALIHGLNQAGHTNVEQVWAEEIPNPFEDPFEEDA